MASCLALDQEVTVKFTPHEYQQRAATFGVQNACAGFFLDPGLGKTAIVLMIFDTLKKMRIAKKMLVITPLRPMYLTWPAEVKKWDEFKHLKIQCLHGPCKASALYDDADVHVINPEGLKWLFSVVDDPSEHWDILCVDESTKFKHSDTERFRLLRPHLDKFRRRYILTGSPAPNGLLDLFGQVYILDLGANLGRYVSHYRAQYFTQGYDGFSWEPRYGAETEIYRKLSPLVLRMSQEDYLKLPECVGAAWTETPLIREVELPPDVKKIYDKMESFLITELENDTVVAANAAAASGKCRQIANGGLYGSKRRKDMNDERGMYDLHEEKTNAVEEIIEELQGVPALVAYEFEHDRDRLLKRFGKNTPWIGGGVSAGRFREIEASWNSGSLPILLAQPQSVSHGLNLQATRAAVIWHSITWDLETYEQLIKRVWRQGQEHRTFVHHIVAKGTIDETVMKMLQKKDKVQRSLLTALKERYT